MITRSRKEKFVIKKIRWINERRLNNPREEGLNRRKFLTCSGKEALECIRSQNRDVTRTRLLDDAHKESVIDGEAYSKLLRIQDTLEERGRMNNAAGKIHCSRATSLTFCLSTQEKTCAQRVIRSFRKVREEFSPAISQMANFVIGGSGAAYIGHLSIVVRHSRPISKEGENRDASYKDTFSILLNLFLFAGNIFCQRVREKKLIQDFILFYLFIGSIYPFCKSFHF